MIRVGFDTLMTFFFFLLHLVLYHGVHLTTTSYTPIVDSVHFLGGAGPQTPEVWGNPQKKTFC